MKLNKIFGCTFCLLFLVSCSPRFDGIIRSYIVEFYDFNAIRLTVTDNNNIVVHWDDIGEVVSFESMGAAKRRHDELVTKFNDLSYNRRTRFVIGGMSCRRYASNDVVSMDIVSNTDFDKEHPAGSSLAGLVRLLSASPIRFIQSGYQEYFNWLTDYPSEFLRETSSFYLRFCRGGDTHGVRDKSIHHHPVNGLLTNLTQENLQLLGTGVSFIDGFFIGYLTFEKQPETPGVHEITVTIHLGDGRVLSRMIEKEFE